MFQDETLIIDIQKILLQKVIIFVVSPSKK